MKLGIDPTAPDLHLGHTVVLRKLKQFQDLGHKVILIIGDFTAQIGDPSGRSEERKPLTESQVKQNLKSYLAQASKVFDVKKAEIKYNSKWLGKGLKELLEIARAATLQQILEREDFQKRMREGHQITYLEGFYPLLQGYDSVAIKADVELGGTDQKFNLLAGRRVQRHFGEKEQDIMTVPLIEGTDGVRKMSKSYGNYIGITEKPNEMFGKIMSVPDPLIDKYFTLLTDLEKPKQLDPYHAKLLLAETIVGMYNSPAFARKAKENFLDTFSKRKIPAELAELKIGMRRIGVIDLLLRAGVPSKSEARRLIVQGAVELNGKVKRDEYETLSLQGDDVLRVGKKIFFRIK